jgi:hypothetical protein
MSTRLDHIGGDMAAEVLTLFELTERTVATEPLPASINLMSAARLLGIGRTCAYRLVRTGHWPTPVIRVGRCIRIPTRPLLVLLDPDLVVCLSFD